MGNQHSVKEPKPNLSTLGAVSSIRSSRKPRVPKDSRILGSNNIFNQHQGRLHFRRLRKIPSWNSFHEQPRKWKFPLLKWELFPWHLLRTFFNHRAIAVKRLKQYRKGSSRSILRWRWDFLPQSTENFISVLDFALGAFTQHTVFTGPICHKLKQNLSQALIGMHNVALCSTTNKHVVHIFIKFLVSRVRSQIICRTITDPDSGALQTWTF